MTTRLYNYAGSSEIGMQAFAGIARAHVLNSKDVLDWLKVEGAATHEVTATFIIDALNRFWIADRHSEHVACARGEPVQAAREITFAQIHSGVEVISITNQSTGYCPEPSCWTIVDSVLTKLGLPHPEEFDSAFIFRRCIVCNAINIVKNEVFECAICEKELSHSWNFESYVSN